MFETHQQCLAIFKQWHHNKDVNGTNGCIPNGVCLYLGHISKVSNNAPFIHLKPPDNIHIISC